MTEKQKKEINMKVKNILEDKIRDIYIELQSILGIKYGDNPIDYAMPEIKATENLANVISETLIWQKEQEEQADMENQKGIKELFVTVNQIMEITNNLENNDFMICMCMLIDEHRATHRNGLTATEIAKKIYDNVRLVNNELGEY